MINTTTGPLTVFSSRAQDPNWDRQRKLRARPYQARMDAFRRARRAWKKSGLFGGMSWNRPPAPPAPPRELAPYVKAVRVDGLEKGVVGAVLRAPRAVFRSGPLSGAVAVGGAGAMLVSAKREADRRNKRKREALFGLRKGILSAIGRAFTRRRAPYGGAWSSKSLLAAHGREKAKFRGMADAWSRSQAAGRAPSPKFDAIDRKFASARTEMRAGRDALDRRLAKFDESKVVRDEDGKFAPKGAGSRLTGLAPRARPVASIYSRGPNWEDREKPDYDWARSVKPTKDMPFGLRAEYARYAAELASKPLPPMKAEARSEIAAPDLSDLPTTGRFKEITRKPQIPSTMTQGEYVELARWSKDRLTQERDAQIERSIGRRDPGGHKNKIMIPVGTDPKDKDVRLAFNVARDLAMHDVGLWAYDHRMTPETIKALDPYKAYIKHTRRYLGDILRREKKGTWGVFRDEFGKEFADGRVRRFDTAGGNKAGEKKKAFARHMHFLKGVGAGALAKQLTEAERKQRIDAARASAAARSKARQQPTARSFTAPSKAYAPIPERHMARSKAQETFNRYMDLSSRARAARSEGLVPSQGVFVRAKPLSDASRKKADALFAEAQSIRPDAMKAGAALKSRRLASEEGPRWRNVGLAPEHWEPIENLKPAPDGFRPKARPAAAPPTGATATGSAIRSASRFGRGAKIAAGAAAGAAALAGAAYGIGRWRERRAAA
jgi:hypothetical protein